MKDLLEMSMPWWEFALRGAICYLTLLVLLRLAGKRAFGEMSPFDIVVLILVGGTLRSAIVGDDHSLVGPLIAVVAILALDKLLAITATRSAVVNRIIEGRSLLLARAGRLIPGALKRADIPAAAFERELRLHQVHETNETDEVRLETNGKISLFKAQ